MSLFFRSRKLRPSSSRDKKSQVSGDGLPITSVCKYVCFLDSYEAILLRLHFRVILHSDSLCLDFIYLLLGNGQIFFLMYKEELK